MDKAHDVSEARVTGTTLVLRVDGRECMVDLARESPRLRMATQA